MGEAIRDFLAKISPDIWLYVCLGILAVIFVALLIVTLTAGDVNKFKRAAKIFVKSPDPKSANASAKKMPSKVTKLYKRAKATGEKPGDVIGVDSAINVPYHTSAAPKFPLIMIISSVFTALIMLAGGQVAAAAKATVGASVVYASLAVVAVTGLVLTVIAFIVSSLFYKGAVKKYDAYIAALDALSKDGNFENVNLDQEAAQTVKAEEVPVYTPASEPQNVVNAQSYGEYRMQADGFNGGKESDFNAAPNAITEDGPVANTIPIGEDTVVSPSFSEPNAVVQDAPVFEPVVTPPPEASAPRVSTPMTTAQDLRARAEAARAERMEREKASAAQNAAISTPMGVSGSADEVIKKIDRAAAEGAPLSTMKEIALQLQQERAKPENKTPEMQKRLSEAQVTLIKAMSSALRK